MGIHCFPRRDTRFLPGSAGKLAIPALIDGEEVIAFLTLRQDNRGDYVYDGKVLEIEVPADGNLTSRQPESQKGNSGNLIRQAREEVIRDYLEVNGYLVTDDAFSIGKRPIPEEHIESGIEEEEAISEQTDTSRSIGITPFQWASEEERQKIEDLAFEQSKESRVVNTDEIRPLLPGYEETDPLIRDTQFHQAASGLNTFVIGRMLAEPVVTGKVLIPAGGGGSGKSTSTGVFASQEFDLTVDTTLSHLESAIKLINAIRDSGREVQIRYVHCPFEKAFSNIVRRYLNGKKEGAARIVPLDVAIRAHVGAQETIFELKGVEIEVVDNSGEIGDIHEISLEELRSKKYLKENEGRNSEKIVGGIHREHEEAGGGRAGQIREGGRRAEAEARLRAEGERILRERYEEGLLTKEEFDTFLGLGRFSPEPSKDAGKSDSTHSPDDQADLQSSQNISQDQSHDEVVDADHGQVVEADESAEAPDLHSAEDHGTSFSIAWRKAQPGTFPENLRDVVKSTNLPTLKKHPDYEAAKKQGDATAAARVVLSVAKLSVIAELKKRLGTDKPVVIVPVMKRDVEARTNALPELYADWLKKITGWSVDEETVKVSGAANTGASGKQRATNEHAFEGPVRTDARYLLVDDTFTSGDSLMALYDHIVENGGEVGAITTLSSGKYQNYLAHRPTDLAKLLDRLKIDHEEFTYEFGFPITQLTGSEIYRYAHFERGMGGVEALRSRILAPGKKAN